MKDELHLKKCLDYQDLNDEIDDYIDYYNNSRYQWNLGKQTPVEYIESIFYKVEYIYLR